MSQANAVGPTWIEGSFFLVFHLFLYFYQCHLLLGMIGKQCDCRNVENKRIILILFCMFACMLLSDFYFFSLHTISSWIVTPHLVLITNEKDLENSHAAFDFVARICSAEYFYFM